jgi:hypothetical protein
VLGVAGETPCKSSVSNGWHVTCFPSRRQGWSGGGRELPLFRQLVGGEVHIALFVGFAVTVPAKASEVRSVLGPREACAKPSPARRMQPHRQLALLRATFRRLDVTSAFHRHPGSDPRYRRSSVRHRRYKLLMCAGFSLNCRNQLRCLSHHGSSSSNRAHRLDGSCLDIRSVR